MRWAVVVIALAAGCGFEHGDLCESCGVDGNTRAIAFCDPDDTTLAGCWELEGSTQDGTGHGMNATETGTTYVPGHTGMAVHIDAATALDVAENPAMDVTSLTIEAWVRAQIPATGRAGILDNQNQYGFFIYAGPFLRCAGFDQVVTLVPDTWTHLACTYDGTVRLYVDGVKVGESAGGGAPLSTLQTDGLTLGGDSPAGNGDPLLGDLDQVRLYNVARTPAQICQDSGLTSCL